MQLLKRAAVLAAMPFLLVLVLGGANAGNECDPPVNGKASCPNQGSSVRSVIVINGEVRGGRPSAGANSEDRAAVRLTGGGSVIVGPKGRVDANGAPFSIRGDGAATQVTVLQDPGLASDRRLTKQGVDDALERLGAVGGDGIDAVAVRAGQAASPGDPTDYERRGTVGDDGSVIVDATGLQEGPP